MVASYIERSVARHSRAPAFLQLLSKGATPRAALTWLLHPVPVAKFRRKVLDRAVLHITRPKVQGYNLGCFGIDDMWDLLDRGLLQYGTNVDVTTFTAARQRQTFNHNSDAAPVAGEVRARLRWDCGSRASWRNICPLSCTSYVCFASIIAKFRSKLVDGAQSQAQLGDQLLYERVGA